MCVDSFQRLISVVHEERLQSFLRFCVVGAVSSSVHLSAFYVQADLPGWDHNLSATISFVVAAANGYALNHVWTFRMREHWKLGGQFGHIFVNLAGLAINVGSLNLLLCYFDPPLKLIAQLPGIPIALIANFLLSRFLVFRS